MGTRPGLDAEESLDMLIDARSRDAEEHDLRIAEAWAESARRYNLAAAAERRREWIDYHSGLAQLHTQLAAKHEAEALQLIDGAKGA